MQSLANDMHASDTKIKCAIARVVGGSSPVDPGMQCVVLIELRRMSCGGEVEDQGRELGSPATAKVDLCNPYMYDTYPAYLKWRVDTRQIHWIRICAYLNQLWGYGLHWIRICAYLDQSLIHTPDTHRYVSHCVSYM